MSNQQPPEEILNVFNSVNFPSSATNSFLTYPVAQGLETFPNGIKFGDGTIMTTADVSGIDISGVANPMTTDLDANDFNILNCDDLEVSTITLNTQSGALTELNISSQTNFGGNKITNVATATDATDGTNKNYVDSNFLLSSIAAATYETIANAASTYLTQFDASTTYLTIVDAAASYLTISAANTSFAKLNSPSFTGNPTAPTQASTDNSTKIATTAFVQAQSSAPIQENYFKGVGTLFPFMAVIPGGWLSTGSFNSSQNPSGSNASFSWILTYMSTGIAAYAVDRLLGYTVYAGYQPGNSSNQGNANRLWQSLPMSGITANTGLGKVGVSNNGRFFNIPFGQAPQPPDTTPTYWISVDFGQNVAAIQAPIANMKWTGGPMMSGPGKVQGATFSGDSQPNLSYQVSNDYGTTWTTPDFGLGAGIMATDSATISGVSNTAPSCMSKNGQVWYKFYNTSNPSNPNRVVAVRSTDGGQTFEQIGPWLTDTNIAPQVACCSAAGDTFYVFCRVTGGSFSGNFIYYSYDYGQTVNYAITSTGSFFSYGPDTWIDCDATGQMLVVVVNADGGSGNKGLWVSRTGGRGLQQVDVNRTGYTVAISGNGQCVSYGPSAAAYQEAQFFA